MVPSSCRAQVVQLLFEAQIRPSWSCWKKAKEGGSSCKLWAMRERGGGQGEDGQRMGCN